MNNQDIIEIFLSKISGEYAEKVRPYLQVYNNTICIVKGDQKYEIALFSNNKIDHITSNIEQIINTWCK